MGRIFLVDLAGSERLKKSKSVGVRAAEARHINLSLHTLGLCVNARSDPNATHVPFRDSKLTRLLADALGGNAKSSMLLAVSDAREHADETFHTCLFGSRAILVRTAPRVNECAAADISALNDKISSQLKARSLRVRHNVRVLLSASSVAPLDHLPSQCRPRLSSLSMIFSHATR